MRWDARAAMTHLIVIAALEGAKVAWAVEGASGGALEVEAAASLVLRHRSKARTARAARLLGRRRHRAHDRLDALALIEERVPKELHGAPRATRRVL